MALLLAGDIGGTKTILRLVERTVKGEMNALYEFRYPSGEFPDLVPMVEQFLREAAIKLIWRHCLKKLVLRSQARWLTTLQN